MGFNWAFKGLTLILTQCLNDIFYTQIINLLQFTINALKSHRQPQCTLQLVCEDRLLYVSVDLYILFMHAAAPEMEVSNSSGVSIFILQTWLFIQPHKQKSNGFRRHIQTALSR